MPETPAASGPVARLASADPVRAAFTREQALFTRHRYDQALTLLTDLLARPDLTARQRFQGLCRKAECLENLYRPRAALTLLREIVRAYPDEALGHSLLGEYLYRIEDDAPAALKALARALVLSPKDADTHWWKGQVYHQGLGDLARGRKAYRAALEVNPRHASSMESLAQICETEGAWIEAIDWRKSHYRRTRAAADLSQLADLYLRLGNAHAALKYARSATARAPRNAFAWLQSAKAHAAVRRWRKAELAVRRFAALADRGDADGLVYSRDFAGLEPLLEKRPGLRPLFERLPAG